MESYNLALAELFKQAAMQHNLIATGILAKLLELTTTPVTALAHWNKSKHLLVSMADTLTLQEIGDYLDGSV